MDNLDIRTLKLLEEIEKDEITSQRALSRKLNISLGLVNSFIKRLANKGYLKITTIPKNRVKYILTPKGASEKARLTYQYIQFSYKFYKDTRQRLNTLFEDLVEQGVSSIVFYGKGDFAEIAYLSLLEFPIELVAIIDEDNSGKKFMGTTLKGPGDLENFVYEKILITDLNSTDKIKERLITRGIEESKIIQPDL